MGLTLYPVNAGRTLPRQSKLYVSWTNWAALYDLLCELGQSSHLFSFTASGDFVDATTAKQWADALEERRAAIYVTEYTNGDVHFNCSKTTNPVYLSTVSRIRAESSYRMGLIASGERKGEAGTYKLTRLALHAKYSRFFKRIIRFFRESGGFSQG